MTTHVGYVPVYLPNHTEVGKAEIDVDTGIATIKIQADSSLTRLLTEDLVGLSVVYIGAIPEDVTPNEGEEKDG